MAKDYDIGAFRERVFNNLGYLLNESARIVKRSIEHSVSRSKDLDGTPFKVLKTATIKAKRAKGSLHPTKPLIDKGVMKVTYIVRAHSAWYMMCVYEVISYELTLLCYFE